MALRERPLTPTPPSEEALFRFQVVSQVLSRLLAGHPRALAVGAVAGQPHATVTGSLRSVSRRTLYRWLAAYQRGGLACIEPAERTRTETSVVLPAAFIEFMRSEKAADPAASVPELILRARERGVAGSDVPMDRSSVWRACQRMGLPTRWRPVKGEADTRRFSYPHRMMLVMADGKHFRAGATRARRVVLFFIDDATRYGLHAVVGTSETPVLFLRGLFELVCKHGFFDIVFLDNGPGFISGDTLAVVASLPHALLVHGTAGYPEGRAKVERFNRTAANAMLRSLDKAAEVDPHCGALELRMQHFLDQYNDRPHESLDQDTPRQRFFADVRALRFPESRDALREHFVVSESRTVSKDHVIRYGGGFFEAPRGLADRAVEVRRNVLDGRLFVIHRGRLVELHPVDLTGNATDRRGRSISDPPTSDESIPKTAATLAFERDYAPVVGPDGGFTDRREP